MYLNNRIEIKQTIGNGKGEFLALIKITDVFLGSSFLMGVVLSFGEKNQYIYFANKQLCGWYTNVFFYIVNISWHAFQ